MKLQKKKPTVDVLLGSRGSYLIPGDLVTEGKGTGRKLIRKGVGFGGRKAS